MGLKNDFCEEALRKEMTKMNDKTEKKFTCSVVGARGYAGLETARLLLQHPNAELKFCFAISQFELF